MTNIPDWSILTEGLRTTVENYLPVPQLQSMAGPFGGKSPFTIADYDNAVRARDTNKFLAILNDAWFRAPESRSVYEDPGFRLLCDICDGSQGDFLPNEPIEDDKEETF